MRTLDVYLHTRLTGHLTLQDSGGMAFRYAESWLDAEGRVPLSNSLPLRPDSFPQRDCAPFFNGVLPEGGNRTTIARLLGLSAENDFALLEARIGRAREFDQIQTADLRRFANDAGLTAPLVLRRARELVGILLDTVDDVAQAHPAARQTAMIARQRAESLAERLGA